MAPLLALCCGALLLAGHPARACSAFGLSEQRVVAKSYDWYNGDGLAVVNKRGVAKVALLPPGARARPARWVSRYGSLTFNQYGREFPLGGINEAGLVVEVLWLKSASFGPLKPGVETVNELQWIQLLLDTADTIEQVITRAKRLQIARVYAQVHYFGCDRHGACAVFEHQRGKLRVYAGEKLPVAALTNSTYSRSLATLRRRSKKWSGPGRAERRGSSSLDRFVTAAAAVKGTPRTDVSSPCEPRDPIGPPERRSQASARTLPYAFSRLAELRVRRRTQWQLVYRQQARRVDYRSASGDRRLSVALEQFDFSCKTPVRVADLAGTVLQSRRREFIDYRPDHNRKLLRISLAALGAKLPARLVEAVAAYPETATRCTEPAAHKAAAR